MLLAPRMFARSHDPLSLARFGRNRLFRGYFAAIVFALAELPLAALLNLRPWVEAVPVLGAIELINEVPSFKYVFGTLLAWLTAAFLVAPVAAWLNSSARANGLLLLFSLPAARGDRRNPDMSRMESAPSCPSIYTRQFHVPCLHCRGWFLSRRTVAVQIPPTLRQCNLTFRSSRRAPGYALRARLTSYVGRHNSLRVTPEGSYANRRRLPLWPCHFHRSH